jgi:hypothetical protein
MCEGEKELKQRLHRENKAERQKVDSDGICFVKPIDVAVRPYKKLAGVPALPGMTNGETG